LLVMTSTGYTEEYRRIQFQDIQGFFTVASERRNAWAMAWIFFLLLGGIIAATNYFMGRMPVVSVIIAVLALIAAVWNHLLGPTCKVYVLTGVQRLQLPALVRRRKAKKVLAKIEPLVAEAQRELRAAPAPAPAEPSVMAEPPPLP